MQTAGRARTTGQPERQAERLQLVEIHHVACAIHRLAPIAQLQRASRRRVVASRRGALDDEAVDEAAGASLQGQRQHIGRDDGQELRPCERWLRHAHDRLRIKRQRRGVVGRGAADVERVGGRLVIGEEIQHAGNFERDAGAHQHVVHAGEHRSVDGGQVRRLDLLQIVDADRIVVTFAGQEDLDEIGDDTKRLPVRSRRGRGLRPGDERGVGRFASGDVVRVPHLVGESGDREVVQGPAHVAAGVAHLQAPRQHFIECRAADHAKLAERRDSARQAPVGDPDAHAALDDHRMRARHWRYLWFIVGTVRAGRM